MFNFQVRCADGARLHLGLLSLCTATLFLIHPLAHVFLSIIAEDGWRCLHNHVLPHQLMLAHFKKSKGDWQNRYFNGTWKNGGWDGAKGNTFEQKNAPRIACDFSQETPFWRGPHAVLDRLVRQRERTIDQRVKHSESCFDGICRDYLLTVATHAKDENRYLLEWIDFHIAIGADKVLIYLDARGDDFPASFAELARILDQHLRAGVASIINETRGQGGAHCGAACHHSANTWWLGLFDADAMLFSPQDISVSDFLATITNVPGVPEQLLVPRTDFGDNHHSNRPDTFMAAAYTRGQYMPTIFQAILYGPAMQKPNIAQSLDCGSHRIDGLRKKGEVLKACEMIIRMGPLLWCPKDRWMPYVIGTAGSGLARVEGGHWRSERPTRRSRKLLIHCVSVAIFMVLWLCCLQMVHRRTLNVAKSARPESDTVSKLPRRLFIIIALSLPGNVVIYLLAGL